MPCWLLVAGLEETSHATKQRRLEFDDDFAMMPLQAALAVLPIIFLAASTARIKGGARGHAISYKSEVVGASGRVGSFFLLHADEKDDTSAAAVPRGVSPGSFTRPGSPIYVATPSASWSHIWDSVPAKRRGDCVFVGNGIPPTFLGDATVVVPHFAVQKVCRRRRDGFSAPIVTSPLSPKTFLYGRHAGKAARILQRHGVETEIVDGFSDIRSLAGRKLLWASCLWLACHWDTSVTGPLTVAQAHEQRRDMIDRLVGELLPALQRLTGTPMNALSVSSYLEAYSQSIPRTVPSKALAVAELEERNGVWLRLATQEYPQPYHEQLIRQVTGTEKIPRAADGDGKSKPARRDILDLDHVHLVILGRSGGDAQMAKPKHVSIVGGGIIGSAIALYLAQRHPDGTILVYDHMPSKDDCGKTTPASWAWINANSKFPLSYRLLNQLGIHAWKHEPLLSSLPVWMGSLVRFKDFPEWTNDGGYAVEGPLSSARILELEPFANWTLSNKRVNNKDRQSEDGFTFHFRDEACVNPTDAVRVLQQAAEELGVRFLSGQNVTSIARDQQTGKVSGI